MSKKKILNLEKGSIAIYSIVTVIFFLIILNVIFFTSSNIRKNQLITLLKIEEIYSQEINVTL